jgi:hypothetical protein
MDTKSKILIASVATVSAGLIGLIIYAITNHTEAGLLNVCWSSGGAADYNQANCSFSEEVRWDADDFPLTVSDESEESSEIQSAIEVVNSQMGCELLRFVPRSQQGMSTPRVQVRLNDIVTPRIDRVGGLTNHGRISNGEMYASVSTFMLTDSYMVMRTLVHEFGHVLGLAHDDFRSSIMYPEQTSSEQLDFIMFSDHDRNLIHNLYCR